MKNKKIITQIKELFYTVKMRMLKITPDKKVKKEMIKSFGAWKQQTNEMIKENDSIKLLKLYNDLLAVKKEFDEK